MYLHFPIKHPVQSSLKLPAVILKIYYLRHLNTSLVVDCYYFIFTFFTFKTIFFKLLTIKICSTELFSFSIKKNPETYSMVQIKVIL